MNNKLLKLQKRTITLIQKSTMRLAELNNILTIINIWMPVKDCSAIVRSLEKRVAKLERFKGFAGKHEKYKLPPI